MTAGKAPRLTWSRLGIVCSIGLVVFGVLDASLPRPTHLDAAGSGPRAPRSPDPNGGNEGTTTGTAVPSRSAPFQSPVDTAARRVAERFVVATDTTDLTHPEGDAAERALLAPGLGLPRQPAWPAAWVAEDRRTTVVLDPPGPALAVGGGQVAVVVTGRTVVTTDHGPSVAVPVDERITLRLTRSMGHAAAWVVTDVGTGS